MNGNILNQQPPEYYAYAILPEPPSTYIAQGYENAHETAFLAEHDYALNKFTTAITYPNNFPSSLFIIT